MRLARIDKVANKIDIPESALEYYGNYKAKISRKFIDSVKNNKDGKLVLVTAITPTKAGEGKTRLLQQKLVKEKQLQALLYLMG